MYPKSEIEFENKTEGAMAGIIVKVTHSAGTTRYFMKTYHKCETCNALSTSSRHALTLLEPFAYRLLNHIGVGPKVLFTIYSQSAQVYFIVTEEVKDFKKFDKLEDSELKTTIIVEVIRL